MKVINIEMIQNCVYIITDKLLEEFSAIHEKHAEAIDLPVKYTAVRVIV